MLQAGDIGGGIFPEEECPDTQQPTEHFPVCILYLPDGFRYLAGEFHRLYIPLIVCRSE